MFKHCVRAGARAGSVSAMIDAGLFVGFFGRALVVWAIAALSESVSSGNRRKSGVQFMGGCGEISEWRSES